MRIAETNFSDGWRNPIPTIALVSGLRRLDLSDCLSLQSETTNFLSLLTSLTDLSLARCYNLQDDGNVAYWSRFWLRCGARLVRLNISGCRRLVSSNGLRYMTALSSLTRLEAGSISVSSELTSPLRLMTSLRSLDLQGSTLDSQADVNALRHLTALTEVNFGRIRFIRNEMIAALSNLTRITSLNISGARSSLSDEAFVAVAKLVNLKLLRADQLLTLNDESFALWMYCLAQLEWISLRFCSQLSKTGAVLLANCRKLRFADLSHTSVAKDMEDNVEDFAKLVGISGLEVVMEDV